MLLRFKDRPDDIGVLYHDDFSMHSKVWLDQKTALWSMSYRTEHAEVLSKKWSISYMSNRGVDTAVFRIGYINGYVARPFRRRYRLPYEISVPRKARKLFKMPYTITIPSPIKRFAIFNIPYTVSIGASKTSKMWKMQYQNNMAAGLPFRHQWRMRYLYNRTLFHTMIWSMPYMDQQVKNPSLSIKFSIPYLHTVSTGVFNWFTDGVNQAGDPIKIRNTLKPRVELKDGKPVIVIPMFTDPVKQDEQGNEKDYRVFITYPPKYINYSLSNVNATSPGYYAKRRDEMASNPSGYSDYRWIHPGESNIGKDITSLLITDPSNIPEYSGLTQSIIEYRIYGLDTNLPLATDADKREFLKSIPGISLAIYSKGGTSTNVYVRDTGLYVDHDVTDFNNPFGNLYYHARDIRDDTINSDFTRRVTADSQLYRIKIKEVKTCCLDKAIDIGKQITTCRLPKPTININITSRDSQEELKLRPLTGFLRYSADPYTDSIRDIFGIPFDQPEEDGSFVEHYHTDDGGGTGTNNVIPEIHVYGYV